MIWAPPSFTCYSCNDGYVGEISKKKVRFPFMCKSSLYEFEFSGYQPPARSNEMCSKFSFDF